MSSLQYIVQLCVVVKRDKGNCLAVITKFRHDIILICCIPWASLKTVARYDYIPCTRCKYICFKISYSSASFVVEIKEIVWQFKTKFRQDVNLKFLRKLFDDHAAVATNGITRELFTFATYLLLT